MAPHAPARRHRARPSSSACVPRPARWCWATPSAPLRRRVHRRQRRHRRRSSAAATTAGRDVAAQRPLVDAAVVDAGRGGRRRRERARSRSRASAQVVGADGEPIGGDGPADARRQLDRRPRPQPLRARRGPGAGRGRRGRHRPRHRRGGRARGRRHDRSCAPPRRSRSTVVGIATFGGDDSVGGVTFTAFTPDDGPAAAARPRRPRRSASWSRPAAASARTSWPRGSTPSLPDGVEAITGAELTEEQLDDIEPRLPRLLRDVPAGVRRRSPCSSPPSASTTRSRSSWPSAPASRPCCGPSAPRGARSLGAVLLEALSSALVGVGRRPRRRHRPGRRAARRCSAPFGLGRSPTASSSSSPAPLVSRRRGRHGRHAGRQRWCRRSGRRGSPRWPRCARSPSTAAASRVSRLVIGGGRRGRRRARGLGPDARGDGAPGPRRPRGRR